MNVPSRSRRAAMAGLAAVALAPVLGASERVRLVGYLSGGAGLDELVKPLEDLGYVLGRNLRFEIRVRHDPEPVKLAAAAGELVAARPDVLLAYQGHRVRALAAATRTIPICCGGVPDPIGLGLAQSLRRPGGNVTGLSWGVPETAGITLGILRAMRPGLWGVASIHPVGRPAAAGGRSIGVAAAAIGVAWIQVPIPIEADDARIDRALVPLAGEAAFVAPFRNDGLFKRVVEAANRQRIATVGPTEHGALMAYGLIHSDAPQRIAALLDKLLRGANPAEVPFELPDRTVFTLHRGTARALGLKIPPDLLLRATEVIG